MLLYYLIVIYTKHMLCLMNKLNMHFCIRRSDQWLTESKWVLLKFVLSIIDNI